MTRNLHESVPLCTTVTFVCSAGYFCLQALTFFTSLIFVYAWADGGPFDRTRKQRCKPPCPQAESLLNSVSYPWCLTHKSLSFVSRVCSCAGA